MSSSGVCSKSQEILDYCGEEFEYVDQKEYFIGRGRESDVRHCGKDCDCLRDANSALR